MKLVFSHTQTGLGKNLDCEMKSLMHGKKSKILKRQMYSDKHARLEQTQTLIKTKCSHLNGNEEKSSMHILGGPIKMLLQNNFLLSFR